MKTSIAWKFFGRLSKGQWNFNCKLTLSVSVSERRREKLAFTSLFCSRRSLKERNERRKLRMRRFSPQVLGLTKLCAVNVFSIRSFNGEHSLYVIFSIEYQTRNWKCSVSIFVYLYICTQCVFYYYHQDLFLPSLGLPSAV